MQKPVDSAGKSMSSRPTPARGLKSRIRGRVKRIYRQSIDSDRPFVSAAMLALLSRTITGPGERRILFIGSRASLEDIRAMSKYSSRYQYVYLERFHFADILAKYLPYEELRENTYHVDEKYRPGRDQAYDHISRVLKHLRRLLRIDAIMSTNLGYLEQQDLSRAAMDQGIPVVILLREGMVDPANAEEYFRFYYNNKRAICDLFICYNDIIRRSVLRQNVPGLTESNVKTSGIPRCDDYVREHVDEVNNQMVVFTFNSDVKFRTLLSDPGKLATAREITTRFFGLLFDLAERRPDIRIVFKTKPSGYYIDEITDMARRHYGSSELPDNVEITGEGSAKDLVMRSRWVMTISNSTTLLESLLANKVTGVPDFSPVIDPAQWDFLGGDADLVTHVSDRSSLDAFIERGNEDPETRKTEKYHRVLNDYLFGTDGNASKRAESFIAELFAAR